jgi:hypothetical protein
MSLQGSLSIERMCQLAQVSRAGFYRSLQEHLPLQEELEVRSAIQQIVLEHRRRYGYRRVTAELRRRGLLVFEFAVSISPIAADQRGTSERVVGLDVAALREVLSSCQ